MLTGGSDVSATPSLMPTGTVTFLLTDVEGSSRRWEATPELMHDAIACHAELLGEAIEAHGGFRPIEQGEGDSIVGAFARASDAVSAAITAQRALQNAARQQAADVIHQHPEASASIAIGRSLDRDELVAYTLEHFSRADLDVVAGPE